MEEITERDYRPRVRLVCAVSEEHFDVVIVGTPLPAEMLAGITRCPFRECGGFIEVLLPPAGVVIEWEEIDDGETE